MTCDMSTRLVLIGCVPIVPLKCCRATHYVCTQCIFMVPRVLMACTCRVLLFFFFFVLSFDVYGQGIRLSYMNRDGWALHISSHSHIRANY